MHRFGSVEGYRHGLDIRPLEPSYMFLFKKESVCNNGSPYAPVRQAFDYGIPVAAHEHLTAYQGYPPASKLIKLLRHTQAFVGGQLVLARLARP